jgi:hypothetical protein
VLNNVIAMFSDLSFSIPGVLGHVHGTYGRVAAAKRMLATLHIFSNLSSYRKRIHA